MMNLQRILAMAGYTPESAAKDLAAAGYGEEESLLHALKSDDAKGLSFIPGAARAMMAMNPGLANQARSMLGK